MKTRNLIAILAATATIITPMVGQAAANPPAFDSCVKAFVASLSSKVGVAPKLREARYVNTTGTFEQPSELEMTARSAHNSRAIARATCYVNDRGEVVSMTHKGA